MRKNEKGAGRKRKYGNERLSERIVFYTTESQKIELEEVSGGDVSTFIREAALSAINGSDEPQKPDHYVPLYGLIAGGVAMEVVPDLPGAFIQPPFDDLPENCYALKVRGKSMQAEMGISAPDGYYALFAPGVIFPNMIVHVEFVDKDGDVHKATLKKYVPQGNGSVEFRPLNKKYTPIIAAEGTFRICGGFIKAWDGRSKK